MNKKKIFLFLLLLAIPIVLLIAVQNRLFKSVQVASTPFPTSMLRSNETANNLPKFNPETYMCENMEYPLKVSEDGRFGPNKYEWQTSAPRDVIAKAYRSEVITLGLRNKYGESGDTFYFTGRVEQPNVSASIANGYMIGNEWANVSYPTDFNGGGTNESGIYTVLYQINGVIVACDGFVVN